MPTISAGTNASSQAAAPASASSARARERTAGTRAAPPKRPRSRAGALAIPNVPSGAVQAREGRAVYPHHQCERQGE